MNKLKCSYITLLSSIVSVFGLVPSGVTEDSRINYDENTESFTFTWNGRANWTYFIQMSTTLMDWTYVPTVIETGTDEEIEYGFSVDLPQPGDAIFLRLQLTDLPTINADLADFDGDGFSNADELAIGADPLDGTDSDMNGIPDDIDAYWASISTVWKEAFVNDSNKVIYDPNNEIDEVSDLVPGMDYDGDGISDIVEYATQSDPLDYYNGNGPTLTITQGDGQELMFDTISDTAFHIHVTDYSGNPLVNAPVVFEVTDGPGQLTATLDGSTGSFTTLVAFTNQVGSIHEAASPVRFHAPASILSSPTASEITARAGPSSVILNVETVDAGPPSPPWGLKVEPQASGGYLVSWHSEPTSGAQNFSLEVEVNGIWQRVLTIPYSQLTPSSGMTSYTVEVDENYNLLP